MGGAGTRNAPLLRCAFVLDGPIASAVLRICGLGYHEAWINQQRVGDHVPFSGEVRPLESGAYTITVPRTLS